MSDEITEKVKTRVTKEKAAVGMVFVGIVAALALARQKRAKKE